MFIGFVNIEILLLEIIGCIIMLGDYPKPEMLTIENIIL